MCASSTDKAKKSGPLRRSGFFVGSGGDDDELLGAVGQDLHPVLLDDEAVLNADAELAGQIDAGLGGADAAGGHGLVIGGVAVGGLVDHQAQAVAVAVAEAVAVAGVGNDLAGGS